MSTSVVEIKSAATPQSYLWTLSTFDFPDMKTLSLQLLLPLANLLNARLDGSPSFPPDKQQPLVNVSNMEATALRVPGSNNATYGPIPKTNQIFGIETLEIAPTPFVTDQIFFIWLRIKFPRYDQKGSDTTLDNASLEHATLAFTLSAVYEDGSTEESRTYTIPLRTRTYRADAHIAIRNASGIHVEFLSVNGPNDILADFEILRQFLRSGDWTFEVVGRLADETCLFAVSLTQWLNGDLRGM
nr:hypothetical protein CFP56_13238 [Quercus suber]